MKIIREGKVPRLFYYAFCDWCGCQVQLTEIEYDAIPAITGYYGAVTRKIKCPTEGCGSDMNARSRYE